MSNSTQTVSGLTLAIRQMLETGFSSVSVEGEVSQPTLARSGHIYFTLKDDGAQIACVIWRSTAERLRLQLEHGQQLTLGGSIQVYPPTGRYQLIVNKVELAGEGALQKAFLALKLKLENEGLFDPSRKRTLPAFPKHIGIVTSDTGAAFQDMRDTLERRWPMVRVTLYHSRVQGVGSVASIVAGITYFSENKPDVIIIGRGGGSLEDLWSFNEEAVARAIAASPVPLISAVGHETDFSISDFVADVRAATPTQAAMMVVPDQVEIRLKVDENWAKAAKSATFRIARASDTVKRLHERTGLRAIKEGLERRGDRIRSLLNQSHFRLSSRAMRISDRIPTLRQRFETALSRSITTQQHRLDLLIGNVQALNPEKPLDLGYVRIMQDGIWIRNSRTLHDGTFDMVWKDGVVRK